VLDTRSEELHMSNINRAYVTYPAASRSEWCWVFAGRRFWWAVSRTSTDHRGD